MSWVTLIWHMVASVCLTLAVIYFRVWWSNRAVWANLLFAMTAASTAAFTLCELRQMRAVASGELLSAMRWTVPNPWMRFGYATMLLILVFVADAGVTAWRRGDRRQALMIGGSVEFFLLLGTPLGKVGPRRSAASARRPIARPVSSWTGPPGTTDAHCRFLKTKLGRSPRSLTPDFVSRILPLRAVAAVLSPSYSAHRLARTRGER
jgi:hypothetical protein